MAHRAHIHKMKMSRLSFWVSIIKETGRKPSVQAIMTGRNFHELLNQTLVRVRLMNELRGMFPETRGRASIEKLPRHCLWCGKPMNIEEIADMQFACNAEHRKLSGHRMPYRPDRCWNPEKRKFVYQGTAIYFVNHRLAGEGGCYRCPCGTYHLTRDRRVVPEMKKVNGIMIETGEENSDDQR